MGWNDPWLQSIDLEYHKIDPERGLYYDLVEEGIMRRLLSERAIEEAMDEPPLGHARSWPLADDCIC
ncbi:MAG: hypothetical protein KatS3mg115_0449 [Candidatus Poribacteria bacterium]|nr:MAG: hypothetical protein KatS3mg115_0449 [Candidatus Poribacteria bacterium]